ncbi:MAG: hypothetical protein A3H93_18730 [Rhodocyclales bacterium RIFCSPLOWO2_02_FULL_63_24]|nr:MAG: hypothetical protein A2040_18390 [Rhodocyclales bacterium GWA2_65_19]OHC69927.1 MAG: hypothetical protein A3H93_18730 [Rhodocyclales bacterium RIFCSPLOWO2_02_FULL_63_24]
MTDPMQLADRVRNACVAAALDGYERAQIAGLCQEGAWECAVDAMRMLELRTILQEEPPRSQPHSPHGPASA